MHDVSNKTDRELLTAYAQKGPTVEEAFAELVRRHGPMVYRTCLRIAGGTDMAQDAAQSVFLVLARRAGQVRGDPGAFLYAVALRVARSALTAETARHEKHRKAGEWNMDNAESKREPWADLRPIIDAALERLPRQQRTAVILHYLEGRSHRETAREMCTSEGTVARHVHRATEKLRVIFTRQGLTIPSAVLLNWLSGDGSLSGCPEFLMAAAPRLAQAGKTVSGTGQELKAKIVSVSEETMKSMMISTWMKTAIATGTVLGLGAAVPIAITAANRVPAADSRPLVSSNPYTGRQEREENFAFAEKPRVTKQGGKYVVAFASQGKCDATVAIVGPNGKIVRHLASGVLGPNAPWPFQQNTLSQSIEWDGKDHRGKPAPAGCRVRVSLGLKPEMDRDLFHFNDLGMISGLAVDRQGRVYAMMNGPRIVVFSRDGAYQRTMWPPPANASGRISIGTYGSAHTSLLMVRQTPQITMDGRLLWLSPGGIEVGQRGRGPRVRRLLATDIGEGNTSGDNARVISRNDGGTPIPEGPLGTGGLEMTISPDQQWIYFGSHDGSYIAKRNTLASGLTPHWMQWTEGYVKPLRRHHAVYRTSLENPGLVEPVLGNVLNAGDDNSHFNWPRGVAFDSKGNLYVADYGNNRIQIFGPAPTHSHLKTIPLEHPDQIAVHPETGAIYALCTNLSDDNQMRGTTTRLVKLGGLDNPVVLAEISGRLNSRLADVTGPRRDIEGYLAASFALDTTSSPPAVWLANIGGDVIRFEDAGAEFRKTAVFRLDNLGIPQSETGGQAILEDTSEPGSSGLYITADPHREELYVRSGTGAAQGGHYSRLLTRIDGRTGKVIERLSARAVDSYMGPDGMLYARSTGHGQPIRFWRYDPDAREYLPFHDAEPGGKTETTDRLPVGPVLGAGTGHILHSMLGVGANGDIYVPHSATAAVREKLKKNGVHVPDEPEMNLLAVFSSTGSLKTLHALDGHLVHRGHSIIRIGPSGAVYMAHHLHPAGQDAPDGLKKGGGLDWGTVVKFNSRFDAFPIGKITQWRKYPPTSNTPAGEPTHSAGRYGAVRIENMAWDYGGMGRLTYSGCTCSRSSFDVDRFERVFVPVQATRSVNILDANGNVIVRVGQYGNTDNRGRESLVVDPDTQTLRPPRPDDPPDIASPFSKPDIAFASPQYIAATDEALYVMDTGRRRLARVALAYAVEETAPTP